MQPNKTNEMNKTIGLLKQAIVKFDKSEMMETHELVKQFRNILEEPKSKVQKYNFSEPQGRLVVELTMYLERDLDNEQLETLFRNLNITINNKEVSDYEVE